MTDQATYLQRVRNLIGYFVDCYIVRHLLVGPITSLFRAKYGADFVNVFDKMARSSFFFVNGDELIDYARPSLHRVVYVGGIAIKEPTKSMDSVRDLYFFVRFAYLYIFLSSIFKIL
jgi:hypothetical protein